MMVNNIFTEGLVSQLSVLYPCSHLIQNTNKTTQRGKTRNSFPYFYVYILSFTRTYISLKLHIL